MSSTSRFIILPKVNAFVDLMGRDAVFLVVLYVNLSFTICKFELL